MIEYKQGGYRAWNDEYATRKPSWKPIIFGLLFLLFACTGVGVVVGMKIYADSIVYDDYERLEANHLLETPGLRLFSDMTLTAESSDSGSGIEVTEEVTPEVTAEIEITEEVTSPTAIIENFPASEPIRAVVTQSGFAPLPTYTLYPTYTPQNPVVIREQQPPRVITSAPRVITSPPQIIEIPANTPIPIVITATLEPEETEDLPVPPTFTPTATLDLPPSPTWNGTIPPEPPRVTLTPTLTLEITEESTP